MSLTPFIPFFLRINFASPLNKNVGGVWEVHSSREMELREMLSPTLIKLPLSQVRRDLLQEQTAQNDITSNLRLFCLNS